MPKQLFRISRPEDSPGPEVLTLRFHGAHDIARGGSVELSIDTETEESALHDLRTRYVVEEIAVKSPPADPVKAAFLEGKKKIITAPEGETPLDTATPAEKE